MQIGRIKLGSDWDFAVRNEGEAWVALSSLGILANETRDVILQSRAIRAAIAAGRGTLRSEAVALKCPVVRPGKIIAIGLNYMDHIRETGSQVPVRPVAFAKYPSALNGPYDPILIDPALTEQGDYESELAVVIGRPCRSISEADALDYVFGYCVANDVSARDWQRTDTQFSRSKSYDTFCPLGPWITTAEEVLDPQALRISSEVNGERRQDSSTKEMLFPIVALIEFLSRTMTLEPGDVILSGTPHGVGYAMTPPSFLKSGDVVACQIEGLGRIENPVVSPEDTSPPSR